LSDGWLLLQKCRGPRALVVVALPTNFGIAWQGKVGVMVGAGGPLLWRCSQLQSLKYQS